MRETDKNNLPIPVCFFFPTGKSWTTPNSASYISYVQRRFCLAPLLEGLWVSRSFDGKDSLAAKLDTRQSTAPKNKKNVPWKSMVAFFFDWNCPFFWGNRKPLFFFLFVGMDTLEPEVSLTKSLLETFEIEWLDDDVSPSGWCCWRGGVNPPRWARKINPKLHSSCWMYMILSN